ncbi:MAG TPA: hypothetical protein VFT43_13870 [Candidatus Polarisedimenticolia bacterium]|nr:hypothetical protein [Candidatus Polarisedimenticolia bacterium]
MPGHPALVAALALTAAAACGEALSGPLRVTLTVPMPARVDTSGIRKILVTRFLVDKELPDVDLDKEMVSLLRREMRKKTDLEILNVEPPPLPEQPLADLLANTGFWRRLAESHGADLVISGKVSFTVADRSGYVQQDAISPVTGQRVRRTVFAEREGFTLDLSLFFLRGTTGQRLYEDHFTGQNTLSGQGNDRLTALFSLFEQFEDDVLGIVEPRARTAQRILFTD